MNEILQQQVYGHYKLWYNIRHKNDKVHSNQVTCNKCRKKFDKDLMCTRKYGQNNKTFYYCPICFKTLKNPK